MDEAENLNPNESEVIRRQIEVTTASMSDKLETLESEVKETVEETKKEVRQTFATLKRAFNIREHVNKHPWSCLGGAVIFGFVIRKWLVNADNAQYRPTRLSPQVRAQNSSLAPNGHPFAELLPQETKSFSEKVMRQFNGELSQIKGIALGALVGMLGDLARKSLPSSVSQKVGEVCESASAKLGTRSA